MAFKFKIYSQCKKRDLFLEVEEARKVEKENEDILHGRAKVYTLLRGSSWYNTTDKKEIERWKLEDQAEKDISDLMYQSYKRNVGMNTNTIQTLELIGKNKEGQPIYRQRHEKKLRDSDPGHGEVFRIGKDEFGNRTIERIGKHKPTGFDKNNVRTYEYIPIKGEKTTQKTVI